MKKHLQPRVLVLSGYGLNCEEETKFAFELAGASADIVHINDLIGSEKKMRAYQVLVFPGGFSYGDDTGSGKAYANKMRNHLEDELLAFVESEKLIIGICNGFQILTNLRLLPGALTYNDGARYLDRWVDLKVEGKSPWLAGIETFSLPIAHGEGKYVADAKTLSVLRLENRVAARYARGAMCDYLDLPSNPNGALEDIAGVLAHNGRVLGMMPHPERGLFTTQLPNFPLLAERSRRTGEPLPAHGPGLQLFKNAVNFF